jgi:DNA-binding MarR family transcriptional regulator
MVTREQATNDRRLVIVSLTEAGRDKMEEGTRLYVDAINSLDWDFTPEEQRLLFKLSRRLWQDNYHRARKTLSSSPRVGDASTG